MLNKSGPASGVQEAVEQLKAAWLVQMAQEPAHQVHGTQQQKTATVTALKMHIRPVPGESEHKVVL